jgi:hypothetical protein
MGMVFYRGPSMLDGEEIVGVLTGLPAPSKNTKTGPMLHTWILRADRSPITASKDGSDKSICGNCPLKGVDGKRRLCYVNLARAPTMVYKSLPNMPELNYSKIRNYPIRLGAYGDHAALPTEVTMKLERAASFTTGYTHQWRTCDQDLRGVLMASCETEEEKQDANSLGWSTFRVKSNTDRKLTGEAVCPASEESGKVLNCISCAMCKGSKGKDVVINVHGIGKNAFGGGL